MRTIVFRAFCLLLFAGLSGSCATVDQFGSRAYDGNLNTQNGLNQEILVNIVRASRYQSVSWNPPSQITGGQTEALTTGLPTINFGPGTTAASQIYSITNSVSSGVTGGYTTTPLATTAFQTGMLTPVDLKTIASLQTYYPREAIFYALIAAIDVKLVSSDRQYVRLVNDPSQAYSNIYEPSILDQTKCNAMLDEARLHPGPQVFFGFGECSYEKFRNLLGLLIQYGLYTELVQIPPPQPTQAQANQSNIITIGRFCFNRALVFPALLASVPPSSFPKCGLNKTQPAGGAIQVVRTETDKFDDRIINTKTKSQTTMITTTTNSIVPLTGRNFRVKFAGIGWVDITFELRSPNGYLNYLGSWFNVGNTVSFEYASNQLKALLPKGDPYLSIVDGLYAPCYSWVNYSGQRFCVPMGARHTAMLMDIAAILRNLNISPSDLNAPVSVRVTN
jgi:hypothetical protein